MKRECKNLNKTWSDLKELAQWRVGVVDVPCPGREKIKLRRIPFQKFKFKRFLVFLTSGIIYFLIQSNFILKKEAEIAVFS